MILTLTGYFVLLAILWLIYDAAIVGHKRPPGPQRYPLLGNLIQIASRMKKAAGNPYLGYKAFSNEYGPIVALKFGFSWQVVLDDPYLIRETLCSEVWADRPHDEFILERSWSKPLGLLWGNGDTWKELRRFSLRTLRDFGFGKQKSQETVMAEELQELMSRINTQMEKKGEIFPMSQFFTVSVLNILWSMVAGIRFSHDDLKFQSFVKTMGPVMRLISTSGNIFIAYPFLRHFLPQLTGYGKARREFNPTLHKRFQAVLEERRATGYYKEDQRDFVDVFLHEIDKNKHNSELSKVYSDEQFIMTMLDLFVAGSDTTSNSLEFAVLFMLTNPTVQKKVQDEIDLVVGRNRFPTMADKSLMPYTEATLLEIQRMANVVPITVRAPSKDTQVGPYVIKKGTFTVFNHYSVHFNDKIWEDPHCFKPERFLDENNKIINTDKMIPFGSGKRMCLGEVLARSTLFTFFTAMMQNYVFEPSPFHEMPSYKNHRFGITLAPDPFFAKIIKR